MQCRILGAGREGQDCKHGQEGAGGRHMSCFHEEGSTVWPPTHQKGRMTSRVMMKTMAKTMKMLLQVFFHPA